MLKVPQGKTAERRVIEERTYEEKGGLVKDLSEEKLHAYLASPVPSADVKAALTKVLAMTAKINETKKALDEQESQRQQLSTDQARLRENLKIIPQTSEPYKKFLDKFVTQETEIEGFQKQIRQLQATWQARQREYRDVRGRVDGGMSHVEPVFNRHVFFVLSFLRVFVIKILITKTRMNESTKPGPTINLPRQWSFLYYP